MEKFITYALVVDLPVQIYLKVKNAAKSINVTRMNENITNSRLLKGIRQFFQRAI
jgi:hypothetical protein